MRRRVLTVLSALVALGITAVAASPGAGAGVTTTSEQPRQSWRANGTVYASALTSTTVFLGGDFTSMTNTATKEVVSRTRLAALDRATGQLLPSWAASADGSVRSLFASEDTGVLYVGGSFKTLNGEDEKRVGAVSLTDGTSLAGFKGTVTNGGVRDIVLTDGKLFIAGTFTKVAYKAKAGLAALNPVTGSTLTGWSASVGVNADGAKGSAFALTLSPADGSLVVGGDFVSLNGQYRQSLGALSTADGGLQPWGPTTACDKCTVFDLSADADSIYAARGGPGGKGIAYSAYDGHRRWQLSSDGDVQAVGVYGDTVYLGGHFGPGFNGQPRNQIAAADAANGRLQPFAPDLGTAYYPGVWTIAAGPDFLRIGGGFKTVEGQKFARYAEFPIN